MTYIRSTVLPNGDVKEIRTNPGAEPRVFINGRQTAGPGMPVDPPPWREYYTLIPRRINGRWYWFSKIYRRYYIGVKGGFYHYGDLFDVLADSH